MLYSRAARLLCLLGLTITVTRGQTIGELSSLRGAIYN